MALTTEERERVRYHLGYANLQHGVVLSLGFTSPAQLLYTLDSAMNALLPEAEPGVRRCIQELDCIEDEKTRARASFVVQQAGNTVMRDPDHVMAAYDGQAAYWSQRLADTMGSVPNPVACHTLGGNGGVIEPG